MTGTRKKQIDETMESICSGSRNRGSLSVSLFVSAFALVSGYLLLDFNLPPHQLCFSLLCLACLAAQPSEPIISNHPAFPLGSKFISAAQREFFHRIFFFECSQAMQGKATEQQR
jgi:hypothetical protein